MNDTYTMSTFLNDVSSFFATIGEGIQIFLNPPLVWFVVMGAAAATISIAKRLIPRKRAK